MPEVKALRIYDEAAREAVIVVWEAVKGGIDAPGVAGEDGLQGVGHALVGGTQAGAHRGDWGTICRLTAAAVMAGLRRLIGRQFQQVKDA